VTWTYDVTSRIARHRVRERIGDVDASRPLIQNEVIDELLVDGGGTAGTPVTATAAQVLYASVMAARRGLASMSRAPDRSVESLSITRANVERYRQIVADLEAEAGLQPTPLATMDAGGLSIAADAAILADPDYARPPFGADLWSRETSGE
jgi:hypothetical protein